MARGKTERQVLLQALAPALLAIALPYAFAQDTQQPLVPPISTPAQQQDKQSGTPPAAGNAPQQPQTNPPQTNAPENNPPEKKDEGGNPVQAVGDMTKKVAETGFKKVRDWEEGLITGTYVSKNRPLVPLNRQQREDIYLQQTLASPSAYWKRMFQAGLDQALDSPPQWGGGWEGYGKRFASREGQFITANSLAALGNAKLGYEVRYEQCRCNGLRRVEHALARNFYTYDRTEKEKHPQWALYGGALAAGMLSAAWKPGHDPLKEGLYGVAGQAGWGTLLNLFIELSTDINRKLGAKK